MTHLARDAWIEMLRIIGNIYDNPTHLARDAWIEI